MSQATPELAVVLATPHRSKVVLATLRCLRQQTVQDRIEVVLVGPEPDTFADLDPAAMAGFADWRTLAVGSMDDVEHALGAGVMAVRAPVVTLLENHVYPEPGWAAAVLRAHQGPWSVVGSVIDNANPSSATSWVEHLLAYGFHDSSAPGGEVERVSRNNATYKRAVLTELGAGLGAALARDGGLLDELRLRGGLSFREPQARMGHLNVSRPGSMFRLRVLSARASAATRVRVGGWSVARRWLYVLASPIFPVLRLRALWPRMRGRSGQPVPARVWPLLGVALIVDSFGQALGFALGAGDSAARAGHFDFDRHPHLSAADRSRFTE